MAGKFNLAEHLKPSAVDQVRDMFGTECESLEQLAMLSQISQAEAKKFYDLFLTKEE